MDGGEVLDFITSSKSIQSREGEVSLNFVH